MSLLQLPFLTEMRDETLQNKEFIMQNNRVVVHADNLDRC